MAINSKKKGDKFERKIAKKLSDRFSLYLKNKEGFLRNLGSGARFGGKNAIRATKIIEEAKTVGDIVTPLTFRFNIECKHYSSAPSLKSVLVQKVTQWDEWIEQAKLDNQTMNIDYWCVIVKYNLIPEFVIIPEVLREEFKECISINYKSNIILLLDDFLSKEDSFYFKQKGVRNESIS